MTIITILTILAAALGTLFLGDFGTTVYSLHRWPAHASEGNPSMVRAILHMQQDFPAMRASIARDLTLLLWTLVLLCLLTAFMAFVRYALALGAQQVGIVAAAILLAGIYVQGRTVYGNACIIRDLS